MLNSQLQTKTTGTTRDGFGIGLKEAAAENQLVVGLCADLTESTRMHWFAQAFPERFLQMGVAEENMVGVAAGLALTGKTAVAASYAVFSPGNSLGPIRASVCYSNLPVIIVGGHAGLTTGQDGATHQALEDIAIMRSLPNMSVVVPADQEEARKAIQALIAQKSPGYIRTSKHEIAIITTRDAQFKIGQAITLKEGTDATIIACGNMVSSALSAAQALTSEGISARVLNMHTIKPLDTAAILKAAQETKAIVTVEEHQIYGGLGSAVAEVLAQSKFHPAFKIMGVADTFGESGDGSQLLEKYGLSPTNIQDTITALLST